METIRVSSFFFLITAVLLPFCASLESNTVYHIRNVDDRSYLTVDSGGRPCWNIGLVGTSSTFNPSSIAQRWLFTDTIPGSGWATLEIIEPNHDNLALNEVSMDSADPWCYFAQRGFNLTPVSGNVYKIQSSSARGCLMSNGAGRRISWWSNCDGSRKMQWEFIKA